MSLWDGKKMNVKGIEVTFLFEKFVPSDWTRIYEVILDEEDKHIGWVTSRMSDEEIVQYIEQELKDLEVIE